MQVAFEIVACLISVSENKIGERKCAARSAAATASSRVAHVVVSVDLFPAHLNVCCRLWIVSDRIFVTNLTFSSAVANVLLSMLRPMLGGSFRVRKRSVACAHTAKLIGASGDAVSQRERSFVRAPCVTHQRERTRCKAFANVSIAGRALFEHLSVVRCGLLISTLAFTSGRMTDRCVRRRSSFATLAAAGPSVSARAGGRTPATIPPCCCIHACFFCVCERLIY